MPFVLNMDALPWVLLAAVVLFGLGWLASRIDLVHWRLENRRSPKAYFRGLNLLLAEQHDAAIDAFVEAVQNDPDTSELHFALGNLFRKRGEYQRAVRVHQHLLARGDLKPSERERAQYALAQDYLKAGLLNFAEEALLQLKGSSLDVQIHQDLLAIYERARDWSKADEVASALQKQGVGDFSVRRAHFACELAQQNQEPAQVRSLLEQALQLAPQHIRPVLDIAHALQKEGHSALAYERLSHYMGRYPEYAGLAAALLVQLAAHTGQSAQATELLKTIYIRTRRLDILLAMLEVTTDPKQRELLLLEHLQEEPSLVAATQWLGVQNIPDNVMHALQKNQTPLLRYRCASCGFESQKYFWQCPGCLNWDSYPPRRVEEL